MRKFIKQFLCSHEIEDKEEEMVNGVPVTKQVCLKCEKVQRHVSVMMEDALVKMVEKGEISRGAYLKAVSQGWCDKNTLEITDEEYINEVLF